MRKTFKRYLALLLAVIMAVSVMSFGSFEASADTYGYLSYTVKNGEVTITDCAEDVSGEIIIPSKIDGYPVTGIRDWAFKGCSSLTSVTMPEGVTSIGGWAFYGCSKLASITIPGSVTSIGHNAFCGCSDLTNMTIPEGVTSIGNNAFYGCSSLTNITIPASVTSIEGWAFFGCSSLTSVTIPYSVTYISDYTFYGCSSLEGIYVEGGNTAYSSENGILFNKEKTTLLTCPSGMKGDYTIPDSVTSIGNCAFNGCFSLTSITIPERATSIGDYAFTYCSSLKSMTIPASVTSIGYRAFEGCCRLTSISIPESLTGISDSAFYGCSGLISITIPESVTRIGDSAFYGCSNLTSITIPESVTSIGHNAFYNTAWYNNQPDGMVYIGKVAYDYKGTILANTSIIIPDGVKSISDSAFYGCSGLISITIPESVTSIGNNAFYGCNSLTNITIPEGVTSIGDNAFYGCNSLTNITIPEGVTSIGHKAFCGCSSLTNITIPEGVTSIGNNAFYGCNSLTNITIPEGVTSIGKSAFYGCSSLTNITIPASVTSIEGWAFFGCSSLTSVTMPESVTSIGKSAFEDCWSLKAVKITNMAKWCNIDFGNCASNPLNYAYNLYINDIKAVNIEIPNGVTIIGDYAFYDCNLKSITIPESVTSIGSQTFYGCSSLTNITIPGSVTSIGNSAFVGCNQLSIFTSSEYVREYAESNGIPCCKSIINKLKPGSVTLKWVPYSGAKKYSVFQKFEDGWFPISDTYDTTYTVIGLIPGTEYEFSVRPLSSSLEYLTDFDEYRFTDIITPKFTLSASNITANTAQLSWDSYSEGAIYKVAVKQNGEWKELQSLSENCTELSNLTSCTEYTYGIMPTDNSGCGLLEDYIQITFSTQAEKVQGLTAETAVSSATLSWTENDAASIYRIGKYENGKWVSVGKTTDTSAVITGLSGGTEYKYGIRICNSNNVPIDDGYAEVEFTTKENPEINLSTATLRYNYASLSWTPVEGAARYAVGKYEDGAWKLIKWVYSPEFVLSGLTKNTTYTYGVRAQKSNKQYLDSGYQETTFTTPDFCIYSQKFNANRTVISWTPVEGAARYAVSKYEDGAWTLVKWTYSNSVAIGNLTYGDTYTYGIRAQAANKRYISDGYLETTFTVPNVTINNLTSIAYSTSSAKLTWDVSSAAAKYEISKRVGAKWVVLQTVANGTTLLTGLSPDSSVTIGVRALDNDGTPITDYAYTIVHTYPECIVTVNTKVLKPGSAILSWDAMEDAVKYQIWEYKNGEWVFVKHAFTNSVSLTGLDPATSYKFGIRGITSSKRKIGSDYSTVEFTTPLM